MVNQIFKPVIEQLRKVDFPAAQLASALNKSYPLWFDEVKTLCIIQEGNDSDEQRQLFLDIWELKLENYTIPLVLEMARLEMEKNGADLMEFVESAENGLIYVFKTRHIVYPKDWEAMEILFEQYLDSLQNGKLVDMARRNYFLTKMSCNLNNQDEDAHGELKRLQRANAIVKAIEENYSDIYKFVSFRGETAFRLVFNQVISMYEKRICELEDGADRQTRHFVIYYLKNRPEKWDNFLLTLRQCYTTSILAK